MKPKAISIWAMSPEEHAQWEKDVNDAEECLQHFLQHFGLKEREFEALCIVAAGSGEGASPVLT